MADHIKLLCDIGELSWIFTDSSSIESFLQKVVQMVAKHMDADVCSIYLYNDDDEQLVLAATQGLSPSSIGKVKLHLSEGLTGQALREARAISERCGRDNPNFKFFAGIHEEHYDAFLAVPIMRGMSKIGVLVVQRGQKRFFTEAESMALRALASQLANMIENAKLLLSIHSESKKDKAHAAGPIDLSFVKGKVAAEGLAFAPATVVDKNKLLGILLQKHFESHYSTSELNAAIIETEHQLESLQKQVEDKLSDVASLIFTAHLLILKDKSFVGTMRNLAAEGLNAAQAVLNVSQQYTQIFSQSSNPLLQEKVQDIQDLTLRIMRNLLKDKDMGQVSTYVGRIIIARELFPSDLLKMSSEGAAGIVLVGGGVTSHLSILARSLAIPMVIADRPELLSVEDSTPVLVDAEAGSIYVNPAEQILANFRLREQARLSIQNQKHDAKAQTFTKDGQRIYLYANINLLADVKLAKQLPCDGIGLYRTEFPFMIRSDFPSEQEQYAVYRKLVEQMQDKPITFRTLDMGGDKVLSYYEASREENPFLGMRAIRFSLGNTTIFTQQIRAMLRAGVGADLRIMFPMISSLDEFEQARRLVFDCIGALQYEQVPHNNEPKIGMMVEIPSVVDLMEDFAQTADFFSIGTNDLVQYMLAVDRTNATVANLYQPCHPAVLRAINKIVDVANNYKKDVCLCGDMAHHEKYIPLLIGLGLRQLSVEPLYLLKMQKTISQITVAGAVEMAMEMLGDPRVGNIARLLNGNGEDGEGTQWK